MARPVVSESALRELLREALENVDARGGDAPAPAVTPNPAMDRASLELELDPIEVRHVPRGKNELIIMVRNLLDTTDDEQSGELYKKIKSLIGGNDTGKKDFAKATELPPSDASDAVSYRSNDMKKSNNMGEATLADAIRDIVQEALAESNELEELVRIDPNSTFSDRNMTPQAKRDATAKGMKNLRQHADNDPRLPTSWDDPRADAMTNRPRASADHNGTGASAARAQLSSRAGMAGAPKAAKMHAQGAVDQGYNDADSGHDKNWLKKRAGDVEEGDEPIVSELGEAIRHIATEALEEAKKKKKGGFDFKKFAFKKKGKAKNEADGLPEKGLPTKGKKKTKTSDFGGGSLAEAIRDIAAEALSETPIRMARTDASPEYRQANADAYKNIQARAKSGDAGAQIAQGVVAHNAGAKNVAKRRGYTEIDEMDEMDEANYDAAVAAEADGDAKLPWGFGKGKFMASGGFDTSRPGDENDLEGPPSDTFRARGGSVEDEFNADGTINFDPNEDISDPEELEAVLAKLTKSAWDPEDEDDDGEAAAPAGKKSPKPRIDVGTGYGVDGDTFEKIGEKLGFTPEAAKKAVAVAQERFKVLHDMDPDDMAELVMTGVDEYIGMLAKTGELDDADIKYLHDNADKVEDSENFREFFSKFVKRAAREQRADTQDDGDD